MFWYTLSVWATKVLCSGDVTSLNLAYAINMHKASKITDIQSPNNAIGFYQIMSYMNLKQNQTQKGQLLVTLKQGKVHSVRLTE